VVVGAPSAVPTRPWPGVQWRTESIDIHFWRGIQLRVRAVARTHGEGMVSQAAERLRGVLAIAGEGDPCGIVYSQIM
jgi:hypothetical protein